MVAALFVDKNRRGTVFRPLPNSLPEWVGQSMEPGKRTGNLPVWGGIARIRATFQDWRWPEPASGIGAWY